MNIIKTSIPGVLILEPKVFGDDRGYFFESFSQKTFDAEVAPVLAEAGILSYYARLSAAATDAAATSGEPDPQKTIHFVQDNESRSRYGVLRGLHFQKGRYSQSKLVRVVRGSVLDVAVDIRRGSPTLGRHVGVELTEDNHRQFFIPKGFAHGFSVLSEVAVFQYKCDEFYHPEAEGAVAWDDPDIGIDWRIKREDVILSEKDSHHPPLRLAKDLFTY